MGNMNTPQKLGGIGRGLLPCPQALHPLSLWHQGRAKLTFRLTKGSQLRNETSEMEKGKEEKQKQSNLMEHQL